MPYLGRYARDYEPLGASSMRTRASPTVATEIDNQSMVDLAIAEFGQAKVSCWTVPRDRRWGTHGTQRRKAAVMHFRMQALGPDDCRLSDFELDLQFSGPSPGDIDDVTNNVGHRDFVNRCGDNLDVCLIDFPAPSCVEGTTLAEVELVSQITDPRRERNPAEIDPQVIQRPQASQVSRTWTFRSSPISDTRSGRSRTARWTWEANQVSRYVQGRILHGGVAICHPGQPFEMTCHVRGKVSKPGGFRLKFSNEHHKPHVWRIAPQTSEEDIQQHIDQLEAEMVRRNCGPTIAESLALSTENQKYSLEYIQPLLTSACRPHTVELDA